jgi:4a-hydroxytetrahydrobiopterin dehydratase
MDLRARRCVPCTATTPKLGPEAIAGLAPQVPCWTVDGDRLRRRFRCPTFIEAIAFVQRMAEVAEAEDHHPDFCVHYRDVDVTVWTHAVGGLTENDFVLAAKIDGAFEASGDGGRER